MGHVLVETSRGGTGGGGASLTDEARHLVRV
jgi:molybdate transport repressor ModE-like protein